MVPSRRSWVLTGFQIYLSLANSLCLIRKFIQFAKPILLVSKVMPVVDGISNVGEHSIKPLQGMLLLPAFLVPVQQALTKDRGAAAEQKKEDVFEDSMHSCIPQAVSHLHLGGWRRSACR